MYVQACLLEEKKKKKEYTGKRRPLCSVNVEKSININNNYKTITTITTTTTNTTMTTTTTTSWTTTKGKT